MSNINVSELETKIAEIEKRIEAGVSQEEFYDLKKQREDLIDKLLKLGIISVVDDFDLYTPIPIDEE